MGRGKCLSFRSPQLHSANVHAQALLGGPMKTTPYKDSKVKDKDKESSS